MVDALPLERRAYPRRAAEQWGILFHLASGHSFRCRFVDVSAAGARLVVPPGMPVRAGQAVRLESPGPEGGAATVVRVQRETLVQVGGVTVAVRFDNVPGPSHSGPEA